MPPTYDFTLLTDSRYRFPVPGNAYVENIFEEDRLLTQALEALGARVHRTHWDDPAMDWSCTWFVVFRTTWDYFERIDAFRAWLSSLHGKTRCLNPEPVLWWNLDKHYLRDLSDQGVAIPPTVFIEPGEVRTLEEICRPLPWKECILKPAVSGAARHTYRFSLEKAEALEGVFHSLISGESMLIQEFMDSVPERGEVSLMVFGGRYSHAILKKAKPGDFRVQDDFGGTVHPYEPTAEEIHFAEKAVSVCTPLPLYARVDLVWDNAGRPCVSELELIEPELWMRFHPESAQRFAEVLMAQRNAL